MVENNLPKKALLILDNASSHVVQSTSTDANFRVLFMPPNATSLAQPLDQSVLQSMKIRYRHKLMNELLSSSQGLVPALKEINLKKCIQFLVEAWNSIGSDMIVKSWRPLMGLATASGNAIDKDPDPELNMPVAAFRATEEEDENEENDDLNDNEDVDVDAELISGNDEALLEDASELIGLVNRLYVNSDSQQHLTIEELFEWNKDDVVLIEDDDTEDGDDEDEIVPSQAKISHQTGYDALKVAYEYAQQQNFNSDMCQTIRLARDEASKNVSLKTKQITLDGFLSNN